MLGFDMAGGLLWNPVFGKRRRRRRRRGINAGFSLFFSRFISCNSVQRILPILSTPLNNANTTQL